MKIFVDIRNESGFGLIHVLAVTLIVSIALLGLFMTIQYARAQADLNYHTRSALLIGQGYLEEIKYDNRNTGVYSRPTVRTMTDYRTIDQHNGRTLTATVMVTSSTSGNPEQADGLLNTFRDNASVKVTWKENPTANMNTSSNKTHTVLLREDYYWKRSNLNAP
jgi:Tfp pilus assembly protein PilV